MERVRKFKVYLTLEQRQELETLTRSGQGAAKTLLRARILLMADEEHPQGRWRDEQIARALGIHRNTIGRIRKRFVLEGTVPALRRRLQGQPSVPTKLDGVREAHLIALCCAAPPSGRARWTLSLLSNELTRRGVVTSICRETVRRTLKKIASSPGARNGTASPSGMRRGLWPRWKTSSTSTPPTTAQRNP